MVAETTLPCAFTYSKYWQWEAENAPIAKMNMQEDMTSSDSFYRNCLCVLEVEMECVLELEVEIKFEHENEMAFHPNTDCNLQGIARWLLPSIQGTCMMFVKNDDIHHGQDRVCELQGHLSEGELRTDLY